MANIGGFEVKSHGRPTTFAKQETTKEDPLEKYLSLYNMFSPEKGIQEAEGAQNLALKHGGEEYAQERGYPNLAAVGVEEKAQQRDVTNDLRQQAMHERTGDSLLKGANAALTLPGGQALHQHLMNAYMQHLGIDTGGAEAPPPDRASELLNKWKASSGLETPNQQTGSTN